MSGRPEFDPFVGVEGAEVNIGLDGGRACRDVGFVGDARGQGAGLEGVYRGSRVAQPHEMKMHRADLEEASPEPHRSPVCALGGCSRAQTP